MDYREYKIEYAPASRFFGANPGPFANWSEAKEIAARIEDTITATKLDIVTFLDGNETRRDSML